jgi:hypothetical protein
MKAGLSLGGDQKTTRPLSEIMSDDSRIGVAEIDRFTSTFDPDANEGKGEYVKVSNVTAEVSIELVCNEGKGYGSQTISEDDLPEAIEALEGIIAAEFERPEGNDDEWQTPGAVIENSWRMVHPKKLERNKEGKLVSVRDTSKPKNYVSFRTRNGRGAKPVEVHQDELVTVLGLLQGLTPEFLDSHRDSLWDEYNSVKSAENAAAQAKAEAEAEFDEDDE